MSYAVQTLPAWQAPSLPPFLHDLLTFRGRMNRASYWWAFLKLLGVAMGLALVVGIVTGITQALVQNHLVLAAFGVVSGAMFMALALPCYFLAIKRLHDRNKSGHWLWLFCVAPGALNLLGKLAAAQGAPPVGMAIMLAGVGISIWGFVEIVCLRGTTGPNRFGPDPLEAQAD